MAKGKPSFGEILRRVEQLKGEGLVLRFVLNYFRELRENSGVREAGMFGIPPTVVDEVEKEIATMRQARLDAVDALLNPTEIRTSRRKSLPKSARMTRLRAVSS